LSGQSSKSAVHLTFGDSYLVTSAEMSIDRGWIVSLVNSRWFALARVVDGALLVVKAGPRCP